MIIFLLASMLVISSCSENETKAPRQYLQTVLSNLKEIKSASYDSRGEAWAPGDTLPSLVVHSHYNAYENPTDTTLGASWVELNNEDTTQLKGIYDGKMNARIFEEKKGILIDSFKVKKYPFRPIQVPFYSKIQDILEYALTTEDSISLDFKDLRDSIYVRITIHEDRQVEFFGKAYYNPEPPYGYRNPTSIYELWIDKSTNLPYKYRRAMEHNISVETVSNAEFNALKIEDFVAASYFPADYEIRQKGEGRKAASPHDLLGKIAPEWLLTNEFGEKVGLNKFESKVILVQFTSVNCGPCRASIPFLNSLSTAYSKNELDLVAIESYTTNSNVLSNYRKRTGLDYQFLMSEKEVNSQYNIQATPVFFLLDENRVIREVFTGYGETSSDKIITEAINKLI